MMNSIRNLFIPEYAYKIVMYKDGNKDEVRLFLDEPTLNRWIGYMRKDGYEIRGCVERIRIIVNDAGD